MRQGGIDDDGLAAWHERVTTIRTYDHDQLRGPRGQLDVAPTQGGPSFRRRNSLP